MVMPAPSRRSLITCLRWLVSRGTGEEGLFRIAGNKAEVRQLFRSLVVNGLRDIPDSTDPNVVGSLAKILLCRLPESVLTTRYFNRMMKAAGMSSCSESRQY